MQSVRTKGLGVVAALAQRHGSVRRRSPRPRIDHEGVRQGVRGNDHLPTRIRDEELEPLLIKDAATWLAAYLQYVDRCRLLPKLAKALAGLRIKGSAADTLRKVASNYLICDRAFGGGLTTEWSRRAGAIM